MANILDFLGKPLSPHEESSFDPEGDGYDEEAALTCGLKPDKDGHWPSRCPHTGQLLKGRDHDTWDKLIAGEKKANHEIFKGPDGKYYSKPKEKRKANGKKEK